MVTAAGAIRALGFRKPTVGLSALYVGFAPPHLGQGTFASQSPITCPKRQLPER